MKKIFTILGVGLLSFCGQSQTALDFEADNYEYVNMGNSMNAAFTGTNNITLEGWVKLESAGFLRTITGNYNSGMQFLLRIDNGLARFWVDNGVGFQNVTGTTTIPIGVWTHIAGSWDGTNMKVFVNGVLEGTNSGVTGSMPTSTNPVTVNASLTNEDMDGRIDDVRIWNVTRTDAEIFANMNNCLTGSETGLLAFYNFETGSGTTLVDITGNGYDGTFVSNPVWVNGRGCVICPTDETINTADFTDICSTDTTIEIASSQTGVDYYLRDNADNSVISGPFVGTGSAMQLNTGLVSATTTYNVYAEVGSHALSLDGTDDYVQTNSNLTVSGAAPRTFEWWAQSDGNSDGYMISTGATGGAAGTNLMWSIRESGGTLWFHTYNNDVNTGYVIGNSWHHYAFTYNGTSTVLIYVDGVLIYTFAVGVLNTTATVLKIGKYIVGGGGLFNGTMDEVRVWNYERTITEINADMDVELVGNEAGLVNYYNFNQGLASGNNLNDTILTDITASGNDGTLNNFALTGSTSNWVGGYFAFCSEIMTAMPTITINPITDQTVAITNTELCPTNTGTTVTTASSEMGVDYFLRDNTNDTIVAGPIAGNGSGLTFNTGALTNSMTYSVLAGSPQGNALSFDGTGDYVVLPNEANYDFTTDMTIEFMLKANSFDNLDGIVTKGDNSWRVHALNTGEVSFAANGAFPDFNSTTVVNDGIWHHVAVTYDGANAMIYVDGTLENSVAATGSIFNGNFAVALGVNIQYLSRDLQGEMDEVRIWNVARTGEEINANRFTELQGNEAGLVSYYKFNQGVAEGNNVSETLLTDNTGNGNNGVLTGLALNSTTSNWVAGSNIGGCSLQLTNTVTVTVQDILAPVADVTTLADVTATCDVTSLTDPAATDNCSSTVTVTNDATLPITAMGPTVVTWTYNDGNGNTSTQTQNVVISNIDITTTTTNLVISANNTTATSYQWIDCGNLNLPISGATSSSYTATIDGDYAVIVTEGNCSDTSMCVQIAGVGIADNYGVSELVELYPNPNNGEFTISTTENNVTLTIYSVDGKVIVNNLKVTEANQFISLGAIESGIYFVKVTNNINQQTIRLIVE